MYKNRRKLPICFLLFFAGFLLSSCNSGPTTPSFLASYEKWVNNLTATNYTVAQGSAYLMQNSDCPTFVAVFDSCFGQNPAAPYIIPQPPVGQSYEDPSYATQFETTGPNGPTDIFYRLSDNDAMITVISYPPEAVYLGYQSYLFTRASSNYAGIVPPRPPTTSPDPSRYDIFGSLGNDINNLVVQAQYGQSPWGNSAIMYITTSNQVLAADLVANATKDGINPKSIFIEPVSSNVITGNSASADDMLTLMRYAVPKDQAASSAWQSALSTNVLVYKVTNTRLAVSRYGATQYSAHENNTDETPLQTALQQLTTLLQNYLGQQQALHDAASYQMVATSTDNSTTHIPATGLVGSFCIENGTDCEGDNEDTGTYATLTKYAIALGPEETVFLAGVNHSVPALNNNDYLSVDVYNAVNSSGVAGSSQTNLGAVGFNSGVLNGSAQQVLTDLKIAIPGADTALSNNISELYVAFIARDCANATIASAGNYCINLNGTTLIPLTAPITVYERQYVMPGTTTGGYIPAMVYPYLIAGAHGFIPE